MAKQPYQTPILSEDLQVQVGDAIQAFLHRGKWKEWGLDKIREQGVAILLHGPPGVGKSITAQYIAKKLHLSLKEISIADFGSQIPGQLARNIKNIFEGELFRAQRDQKHPPVMLLDECDAVLVSRKKITGDMLWMLEPINALLNQIGKYPGLVVLATNLAPILDEALERRLLAKIFFGPPEEPERREIWEAKFPEKFPVQPTEEELDRLGKFPLTGATIENALLLWAGRILREDREPVVSNLIELLENKFAE
jgi:SpoVK/Ycf46/Vps4 family AAA+-type ATPase